jgi:O-antigen ligase
MFLFFTKPKTFHDYLILIIKIGLGLVLFLPLVVSPDFYFPFIVPRNLFFRLIIDIIFILYFYLCLVDKQWRPKFNKGFIFLILFILSLTISSLLGGDFLVSFWSNFERMDGLLNWYHILMYVVVLLGVIRHKKEWLGIFKTSLIAAWLIALLALGQRLGINMLNPSTGGARLTSTLGNAAYLASYMFLNIVLVLYLWFVNKLSKSTLWPRMIYFISAIVFTAVLIGTETRGAFLGLLLFIFLFCLFYLYFERKNRNKSYYAILILILAGVLFVGLLFQQKQAPWVQNVSLFNKVANLSLTDTTAQSRLTIWRNSMQGVQEKPIFGWGEENFHYVFNQYFPVEIFHDSGSEVWFDRPHNILVQHLVQGGILGLALYLSIFIYLISFLYRRYRQSGQWQLNFLWIAFLLSFLFHDLFIFDSLNTNIVLYLFLAFLFQRHYQNSKVHSLNFAGKQTKKILAGLIAIILLFVFLSTFFAKPLVSNLLLVDSIEGMSRANTSAKLDKALDTWQKSFGLTRLGDKEKVQNLYRFSLQIARNPQIPVEEREKIIALTQDALELMASRYPLDVRNNEFVANFYYDFGFLDPTFLDKSIGLFEKLHRLAPQRPEIFLSLTNAYLAQGDLDSAQALAQEFADLMPWTAVSHWNLFKVNLVSDNTDQLAQSLDRIKALNMADINKEFMFSPEEYQQLQDVIVQAQTNDKTEVADILSQYLAE